MKRFCLVILLVSFLAPFTKAQLSYKSTVEYNTYWRDTVYVGISQYTPFVFGDHNYLLEMWDDGLNYCIPWPTSGTSNYVLFINKHGGFNIGKNGTTNGKTRGIDVAGAIRVTGRFFVTPGGVGTRSSQAKSSKNDVYNRLILLEGKKYIKNVPVYADKLPQGMSDEEFIRKYGESKYKTIKENSNVEKSEHEEIGFIAQDVQKLFPDLVFEDSEGMLSIQYLGLLPYIIEALGEQDQMINNVSEKVGVIDKFIAVKNNIDCTISGNKSSLTISYKMKEPLKYEIMIYNINGLMVEKKQLDGLNGEISIDKSSHKSGVYFYNIINNGEKIESGSLTI